METHVARWGNSLALRIPRQVANRLGLDEGRAVELTVEADRLVIRPRLRELRLDDLLVGITPDNLPGSFDDAPVGEEVL